MASRTNLRLAEIIRQRAAHVILFELKDPRMGFVTITKVKLSPDLASATILWSVLGSDGQKSKTTHALEHARLFVQRRVAEGLRTRVAPEVIFEYDESVEGSIRMGTLLHKLRSDRGEDPAAADAPDAADEEDESEEGTQDETEDEEGDEAGDEADGEDESDEAGADEDEPPSRQPPE